MSRVRGENLLPDSHSQLLFFRLTETVGGVGDRGRNEKRKETRAESEARQQEGSKKGQSVLI